MCFTAPVLKSGAGQDVLCVVTPSPPPSPSLTPDLAILMFRLKSNLLVPSAQPPRTYGSASFVETQAVVAMILHTPLRIGKPQVTAMPWTSTRSMFGTMLATAMFID